MQIHHVGKLSQLSRDSTLREQCGCALLFGLRSFLFSSLVPLLGVFHLCIYLFRKIVHKMSSFLFLCSSGGDPPILLCSHVPMEQSGLNAWRFLYLWVLLKFHGGFCTSR